MVIESGVLRMWIVMIIILIAFGLIFDYFCGDCFTAHVSTDWIYPIIKVKKICDKS